MLDVIEAIDGPICLNTCLISGKDCGRKKHCPAHPVWVRAQQAMLNVLIGASITALAGGSAETTTTTPFMVLNGRR